MGENEVKLPHLSPKKLKFALKYLETGNLTQSAVFAGYSATAAPNQGSRLVRNEDVQRYLAAKRQELEKTAGVSIEWVLKRFKDISDRCMQAIPVMEFDPVNKCMTQKTEWDPETGEEIGVYQFDSAGANKATENLGKIIGAYEKDNSQKGDKTVQVFKIGDQIIQF